MILFLGKKSGGHSTTGDFQSYEQKVMTVEEIERANPSQFLDASGRKKIYYL
ncbi:MAG: hypothetical protein IPG89_07350 [Bacteroidetes bacterium]|nr:hypothetical protein [Bacteroidota bacterium]